MGGIESGNKKPNHYQNQVKKEKRDTLLLLAGICTVFAVAGGLIGYVIAKYLGY